MSSHASPAIQKPPADGRNAGSVIPDAWSNAGRTVLLCLAIYFGLHVLTRSVISNSLQLDESEQLILTQDWRWGYGSQPPLYNWLQTLSFSVFGLNVFALSLLKNTVLWSICYFVYRSAREIFQAAMPAAIATASVLFLPQISWEAQRDQSHLILATACAAATLFLFLRTARAGKPAHYAMLGAVIGLGLLAKYNYLFFALALLLAALSLPRLRPVVLNPKMLLAVLVFLVITAPHFHWLIHNQAVAAAQSSKFKMDADGSGLLVYMQGSLRLVKVMLVFLATPLLIYSLALYRTWKAKTFGAGAEEERLFLKLLLRTFAFGLLLTLAMVLIFRVTFIRERWLAPLLFALPILLAGWTRPQLRPCDVRAVLIFAACAAVMVLVAINGTVVGANLLNRSHNLNVPHAALAAELRKAGFSRGTIIANRLFVGGNLKMHFKDSLVIVQDVPYGALTPGPRLIVWSVTRGEEPTDRFFEFAGQIAGIARDQMEFHELEVPCRNGPRKSERIGFVLVENRGP